MIPSHSLLAILFFATALIYAIGGFGGGSTYLALMAFMGLPYEQIPIPALLCNIVVVSMGCHRAIREKQFSLKLASPFVITSVPFSFLAARLPISETFFYTLLALSLAAASLRLLSSSSDFINQVRQINRLQSWMFGLPIGAGIGFLSGLTGIGGGIFLSPILHLKKWADPKSIAGATSFFILVNSFAGLAGRFSRQNFFPDIPLIATLLPPVLIGGYLGAKISYRKLQPIRIRQWSGLLILFIALRLFWQVFSKGSV